LRAAPSLPATRIDAVTATWKLLHQRIGDLDLEVEPATTRLYRSLTTSAPDTSDGARRSVSRRDHRTRPPRHRHALPYSRHLHTLRRDRGGDGLAVRLIGATAGVPLLRCARRRRRRDRPGVAARPQPDRPFRVRRRSLARLARMGRSLDRHAPRVRGRGFLRDREARRQLTRPSDASAVRAVHGRRRPRCDPHHPMRRHEIGGQRTASPMRSASARFATILANRRPADGRRTTVVTPTEFRWPRIAPSSCRLGEIRP
jgi:hypothetical protein